MVEVAYPFVNVTPNNDALKPRATRSAGVVAVVGRADGSTQAVNVPRHVSSLADAGTYFAAGTPLLESLATLFRQPRTPERVYAVRAEASGTDVPDYGSALASLEALDDITGVALAAETDKDALELVRKHAADASDTGNKRIAYGMVRANLTGPDYPAAVLAEYGSLSQGTPRFVLVAARGVEGDVAVAAMAAVHAHDPHISALLKPLSEVKILPENQFTPAEITKLSEERIIPVIDPQLMPGRGLHLAEGTVFSGHTLKYIDQVRTLDDIEFRLRAGLFGLIADARITRVGLTRIKNRIAGILDERVRQGVLTRYATHIPVLDSLQIQPNARSEGDKEIIDTARLDRVVAIRVDVVYGPAVHRIEVELATPPS